MIMVAKAQQSTMNAQQSTMMIFISLTAYAADPKENGWKRNSLGSAASFYFCPIFVPLPRQYDSDQPYFFSHILPMSLMVLSMCCCRSVRFFQLDCVCSSLASFLDIAVHVFAATIVPKR